MLYRSLARHCADFRLWVFCLDRTTETTLARLALPGLELIPLSKLEQADPALRAVKGSRSRTEYYWTATPATCLYLLQGDSGLDHVVHLDTDLEFYGDPAPLFEDLDMGSVLLTPHRVMPEFSDGAEESGGEFNVQFEIFRRDTTGLAALRWWHDRCIEWCYDRFEAGRYGDQKYLEALPRRFDGIRVNQRPGAGLAPWNIARYRLAHSNGGLLVDGEPLIFHHFQSLEVHPANLFARAVARRSRSYRLMPGPHPFVWTTGWRLTDSDLDILWEPYVARLSQALADLAPVSGPDLVTPARLTASRASFHVLRHHLPGGLRSAYWSARTRRRIGSAG